MSRMMRYVLTLITCDCFNCREMIRMIRRLYITTFLCILKIMREWNAKNDGKRSNKSCYLSHLMVKNFLMHIFKSWQLGSGGQWCLRGGSTSSCVYSSTGVSVSVPNRTHCHLYSLPYFSEIFLLHALPLH